MPHFVRLTPDRIADLDTQQEYVLVDGYVKFRPIAFPVCGDAGVALWAALEGLCGSDAPPVLRLSWPSTHTVSQSLAGESTFLNVDIHKETYEKLFGKSTPSAPETPKEKRFPWEDYLVFDDRISREYPVVKGTFVAPSQIVSRILSGWSWSDILNRFPEITEDDIKAILAYTVESNFDVTVNEGIFKPTIEPIPSYPEDDR